MQPSTSPSSARGLQVPPQGRRRGHVPQISISDDNHHVTEAIGDMYGDDGWDQPDPRYFSFVESPAQDHVDVVAPVAQPAHDSRFPPLQLDMSTTIPPSHGEAASAGSSSHSSPVVVRARQTSFGASNSPIASPQLSKSPSDTASQPFPLNDIDYESSPAAVAQELSNLQAIRRMSMNVDAADPDLPSFSTGFVVPTIAPAHGADEDDTSRLFWVPASLHPELAPKEFKTFIQDRVETIRRRSGSTSSTEGSLSPDSAELRSADGSIKRRKSMLSRTIDTPIDYKDGAERLEGKRSQDPNNHGTMSSLQELESLVNDPSSLVRTLSIDTARKSLDSGVDVTPDDMPILPPQPAGQSLKRSTRTNYRRGSLRKGERVSGSRRVAGRLLDSDGEGTMHDSVSSISEESIKPLARSQTEPIPLAVAPAEPPEMNFSRPSRIGKGPTIASGARMSDNIAPLGQQPPLDAGRDQSAFHSRIASNGRTTAAVPVYMGKQHPPPQPPQQQPIPQIIETPPPNELTPSPTSMSMQHSQPHPERKSSHDFSRILSNERPPERSSLPARPVNVRQPQPLHMRSQTLNDMANHPAMIPGNSTRTDTLSFIPTYTEEKKPEKTRKSGESSGGTRKSSWGWLLGSNDEKDKDKKEGQEKESGRKNRLKLGTKSSEKPLDATRLDLLQTATDGGRGRESLVLDRESIKLDDERRKETARKSSGSDGKKTKDSGIFSFLGGGKKKADRDSASKRRESNRGLSPEPPRKIPIADVDYNWTRFSILEERAIYRMAHIKLANPRRALYSQVLLSNFMYSYLAKVQQMHPQIQIPNFVTQKQQQAQQQQAQPQAQPQAESEEFSQWQRYQESQQQHSLASEDNTESSTPYVDDYDPQHQQHLEDARQAINGNGHSHGPVDYTSEHSSSSPYSQPAHQQPPHQQQQQQQQQPSLLFSAYGNDRDLRQSPDHFNYAAVNTTTHDDDMW